MSEPRVIGEARDCNELVELYRKRKEELGLTDKFFDQYSGLAGGHIGKLLGPAQIKMLGSRSIHTLNCTLAVKFIVVVDDEAAKIMGPIWGGRERPAVDAQRRASLGKNTIKRVAPVVMREMGKRGNTARQAALPQTERTRIARHAAQARWKKRREKRAQRVKRSTPPETSRKQSI